jgi:hypothetical protein
MVRIIAFCALLCAVVGCRKGADAFFSGRPSGMAMVHNRVIGGGQESMLDLLRVPSRFPDATDEHIGLWQNSVVAWWNHGEKNAVMIASYSKLTAAERSDFVRWVQVRHKSGTANSHETLDVIDAWATKGAADD